MYELVKSVQKLARSTYIYTDIHMHTDMTFHKDYFLVFGGRMG
jgi:hypothetical protein